MSLGRSVRRFGWVGLPLAVLCAFLCAGPVVAAPLSASAVAPAPSAAVPVLRGTNCHPGSAAARAGFQCASAVVPLDYQSPGSAKITLAVVRHPATGPARRLGSLFINPGGPGGRGTNEIPELIRLVPATLRARFDVVSWDPRGVGESTAVQCFASRGAENTFLGAATVFPVGAAQELAYIKRWAQFGQRCAARDGALLGHVTTAETARDLDLLRRAVGDPKLNYLGLSYGTYLGATYANLFPDKVGALVLDGNVAPEAWTNGGRQRASLSLLQRIGSDTGGYTLATTLAAVRPGNRGALCVLRRDRGQDTGEVRRPAGPAAQGPDRDRVRPGPAAKSISNAELLEGVYADLYVVQPFPPLPGWSGLAKSLQELWHARGQRAQSTPATPPSPTRYAGDEQYYSIVCADSPSPGPLQISPLARQELRQNGPIGLVPLWEDEPCSTWPVHSATGYFGPWNTRTAAPILVIGNTTDPATPLKEAVEMSAELARARLLVVRGYGHTAFFNPSRCANNAEIGYFVHGVLPSPGTVCEQDSRPFQGNR